MLSVQEILISNILCVDSSVLPGAALCLLGCDLSARAETSLLLLLLSNTGLIENIFEVNNDKLSLILRKLLTTVMHLKGFLCKQ